MSALRNLARQLEELRRRVDEDSNAPQLGYSSIEDGTLTEYDGNGTLVQVIGKQFDGTHTTTQVNGQAPPVPTNPATTDGTESFSVTWLGDFVGGGIAPMDFLRVDVHAGGSSGFTPSPATRVGEITAALGGTVSIVIPAGTYYVKLVTVSQSGIMSAASEAVEVDSWPVEVTSDGFAPASSPQAFLSGGVDIILARWTAITNADPVKYQVHVSTTDGFTPVPDDPLTLAGVTESTAFTLKLLPGDPPALPTDEDLRKLVYGTTYYIKIIAVDDDGAAAPGVQDGTSIFQLTGVNLSADSVTAAHVLAGTLTGDLFSASVIISGAFRTAETGQRVEMTPLGFFAYKPDGSVMLRIPTDSEDAFFDGELVVRGATILGGMSIQSSQNELTADAAITLMRGIVAPTTTPQFQITWDTIAPSTASLSAATKTNNHPTLGLGGPFDLIPSEVSSIDWRTGSGGYFAFNQIRPNGTRTWYFDATGAPIQIGGAYYSDIKDWEIWSSFEMLTSSAPKNGTYVMFRYMDGAGTDYYISGPAGLNRYSRQNGVAPPVIGNNGTDMFIAEIVNTDDLRVRYFVPDGTGATIPNASAIATYDSTTGYSASIGMCNVTYSSVGFDIGTARYLTAQRGISANARLLNVNGVNLYPGGSGNNWASANKEAESFESPTSNRRAMAWDGTQFWTYGADGLLYKHTSERWDPAVTSSQLWGQVTLRDDDAAGTGTHETTPGTAKAFTHKRRSKFIWTPPSVPDNGGTDDPNQACLYMGRIDGATKPANSAMYKQGFSATPGLAPLTITTLLTATANPPTVNSFPASNAALIRNDNDELQIKGDGTAKFKQLFIGADEVLALEPYWYGYLSAVIAAWNGAGQTITGWVADGSPNSSGITAASGVYTMPRAGRYNIKAQIYWAGAAGLSGQRILQAIRVSPSTTIVSHTVGFSTINHVNQIDKDFRFAAGEQVFIRITHSNAANISNSGTTPDLNFLQIKYVGP